MLSKPVAAAVGAAIAFCAIAASAPRRGAAAPVSACSDTVGVTVIVDFTHFGGAIERGCDPEQAANALDAVHTAGFTTAGTARYGDAFLCRIDSLPSPRSEACTNTPPAKSSWSFYYARATDKAWTYSNLGVLSYHPTPGMLLAFAFGNYAKPGVLPSGAAVPTTTTTTAAPRKPPHTTPHVTGQVHPPATTAPTVIAAAPSTAILGAAPTSAATTAKHPPTTRRDAPTTTRDAAGTTTTAGPRIIDKTASGPVATDGGGSGSPGPALITLALIAALGAGAFATIRVRRRRGG